MTLIIGLIFTILSCSMLAGYLFKSEEILEGWIFSFVAIYCAISLVGAIKVVGV